MRASWLVALSLLAAVPAAAAPARQPLYVYASVGDNQWVSDWPPIDSKATVEALFDWLSQTYGARRIYWRGGQDRMCLESWRFRKELPLYHDWWTRWVRHLSEEVGTDDLAIAAARKRGMQIYLFEALFDHGAPGDVGGCGAFPYSSEDRLRIEHPEWCPVDRWGERRCPGPIEFCYPEARRALVKRYLEHTTRYGYDGISFYTYVENLGLRYNEEFGYNEPIAREFRRRYGVDIRTQPFDRDAWCRLRGEYLTQFLRELHAALSRRGKKVSVTLRPEKPELPQRWYGTGLDMPGAGMVALDWETWVKEGIVDEIFIWHGGDPKPLLKRVEEVRKGKPVEVAFFCSTPFAAGWKPFIEAGATPVTVAAPGYGIDRLSLEPTGPETLRSPDWRLRAQTLADVASGVVKADVEAVAALAGDEHVLVRREVMRALGKLKAAGQVALLEGALADRESSVRIAAASALAQVNGPDTPARLLAAVRRDGGFQMKDACVAALAAMKERSYPALVEAMADRSTDVREACARALGRGGLNVSRLPLAAAAQTDADERIRYWSVDGLARLRQADLAETFIGLLGDDSPMVQLRAAQALGELGGAIAPEPAGRARLALEALFRAYGDGSKRPDAAWGWRVAGNALLGFGDAGRASLERMRAQRADRWLAWAAYEVLYVPQNPHKPVVCDEKDAVETHRRFAPPFPGYRR